MNIWMWSGPCEALLSCGWEIKALLSSREIFQTCTLLSFLPCECLLCFLSVSVTEEAKWKWSEVTLEAASFSAIYVWEIMKQSSPTFLQITCWSSLSFSSFLSLLRRKHVLEWILVKWRLQDEHFSKFTFSSLRSLAFSLNSCIEK